MTGVGRHEVAITMGSGWRPAADILAAAADEVVDLTFAQLGGFPTSTAVPGHRPSARSMRFGGRRLLADHLNLTGRSPLTGPIFTDLTDAYAPRLRALGADVVGMSTVHETIAARTEGAEVLGLSLVTNLASGLTDVPLDHREVLAAGAASAQRIGHLLADLITRF
ncbi:hypothetical protein MXD61_10160 [Frankia sp. AgPm24]|uniref:phosphorylase family protein n=1 Tax=Frankia sp. AgPm24 TaxID=631128 RepID=UPI00200D270C|nr:hypothetical protein [Frankia sp. AgPm24]MCK9922238.1 hypothetical protein [Frankia sp. AgPm24]